MSRRTPCRSTWSGCSRSPGRGQERPLPAPPRGLGPSPACSQEPAPAGDRLKSYFCKDAHLGPCVQAPEDGWPRRRGGDPATRAKEGPHRLQWAARQDPGPAGGPGSVIQQEAGVEPPPTPGAVPFLRTRRALPRAQRSQKEPREPTSQSGGTKPRLPPALPAPAPTSLLQNLVPGGGGPSTGHPPGVSSGGWVLTWLSSAPRLLLASSLSRRPHRREKGALPPGGSFH